MNIKLNWKTANKVTSTAGRNSPTFSLTKNGFGRANKRFKERNALFDVKSVSMKYEENDNKAVIGFRFFKDKKKGDFSVSEDKRTGSLWFSVRSLFNNLNIDKSKFKTKKFKPEIIKAYEGEEDIFLIEINMTSSTH